MLENFNNLLADKLDYILGWMLFLPRDVMLIMLAVLTSAVLTFVRLFTTDQKWLARADADCKRLNELVAESKIQYASATGANVDQDARKAAKAKFKEARTRYKATQALIKFKSLKYEFKPLAYSLIPIALMATWAFSRVAYAPPKVGQELEVRMIVPTSAIGKIAFMSPQPGLDTPSGVWVQRVVLDQPKMPQGWWDIGAKHFRAVMRSVYNFFAQTILRNKIDTIKEPRPVPRGVVVWKIIPTQERAYSLNINYNGETYEKSLLAGERHYSEPVRKFDAGPVQAIELGLKQQRLFGAVGAIDWIWLAPWLVAYLLVAIPFVTVLKRTFKIY